MTQPASLDPTTVRRLAFVKYLYKTGVSQSKAPEPLGGASLLTFHDSVELFNQIASEHVDSGAKKPNFMDYWGLISQKLHPGVELSQKVSMERLNNARIALKHHGTLPAKLEVEAFRASVTAFFQDNTQTVFGLPFDNISLIDFVQPDEAKEKLQVAEKHLDKNEIEDAMNNVALAFRTMLNDYEGRKKGKSSRSPLLQGGDLRDLKSLVAYDGGSSSGVLNVIIRSLDAMQQDIKMLALGLNYRRYAKFRMHTPQIHQMFGRDPIFSRRDSSDSIQTTPDDVRFCIEFVIETSIILQEFDYSIDDSALPSS